ncbi:S1C family serine protease [candidate division KSB1 bacterium]
MITEAKKFPARPFYYALLACLLIVSTSLAQEEEITSSRRNAIVRTAEAVGPKVVSINITRQFVQRSGEYRDFFDLFEWYLPRYESVPREIPAGSGFVVDPSGLILTNAHVVQDAKGASVAFPDGRSLPGEIVERDDYSDLALIKVEGGPFQSAELGDSDDLIIGEWAIAVGNPFGTYIQDPHPTVTAGVVSAINRSIRPASDSDVWYRNMIQTDAAINPGNSGGPLANSRGQVIGINTFILSTSQGSQGMGFAIPINLAKRFLAEIRQHGRLRNISVGFHWYEVTPNIAAALGFQRAEGIFITQVDSGGAGSRAGLQRGDVILNTDGEKVRNWQEFRRILLRYYVGDTVRLGVIRDGEPIELEYQLKEGKQ